MNLDQFNFGAFLFGENAAVSRRLVLASAVVAGFMCAIAVPSGAFFHAWVPFLGADVRLLGIFVVGLVTGILATYNAYANRGLLVSYLVVFLPVFAFFYAVVDLGHPLDHSTTYVGPITNEFVYKMWAAVTSSAILTPILHVFGAGLRHLRWFVAGRGGNQYVEPETPDPKTFSLGEDATVSKRLLLLSVILAGSIFAVIILFDEPTGVSYSGAETVHTLVLLIGVLSMYNAYANKGILVSFALVYIPTFGYLSTGVLYGVAGRPPTFFEEHILAPLVGTVMFGSVIAIVAYTLGAGLRHFSRILKTQVSR